MMKERSHGEEIVGDRRTGIEHREEQRTNANITTKQNLIIMEVNDK